MTPETKKLALIGAAGGLGYAIYRIHTAPAGASAPKGSLPPGWYWAFVSQTPDGTRALNAYLAEVKGKVFVRKTISPGISHGYDLYFNRSVPAAWILFEATAPFVWTLPGRPSPAPKGAATDISDVQGDEAVLPAITSPEHPWNQFWNGVWSDGSDGKDPNPLLAVWKALGTAGPLLVYGAAGVVLFKLWAALGAPSPLGRGRSPRLLPRG